MRTRELKTRWGVLCWFPNGTETPPAPPIGADEFVDQLTAGPLVEAKDPARVRPLVEVLGPPRVNGTGITDARRRWKYTKSGELVCLLALAEFSMGRDAVMEALWPGEPPDPDRLSRIVSDARTKALGADAFPKARDRLAVDVDTDLERFRAVRALATEDPGRRRVVLSEALGWVRGEPFEGTDWGWARVEVEAVRAEVAAAGLALAELELEADDPGRAIRAARKGLFGDPWSVELLGVLWRAGLRAEDAGVVAWVHARMLELEDDAQG